MRAPVQDSVPPPAVPGEPELALSADEGHPRVRAFLADQLGDIAAQVPTAIGAGDEMLGYALTLHHGHRDLALLDYFRSGLAAARVFEQILAWRFGGRREPPRVLDFAAGWGRVTRFLRRHLPADHLWVSDISTEALAFQQRELGVRTLPSTTRPEELELPGRFDAILVASLFTHLPRPTFVPWLRRLLGAVAPGGLLVFSTHGELTLPEAEEMPADGFWFEEQSEIETLEPADYGRTLVTPAYVRSALAEAAGGSRPCLCIPQGLWHLQDLWVVSTAEGDELSDLSFNGGPDGHIGGYSWEGPRRLWLGGWLAHHTRPELAVEVAIGLRGEVVRRCPPTEERPDVARRFRRDDLLRSGWLTWIEAPDGGYLRSDDPLSVRVVDAEGAELVLYLGTLEGLTAQIEQAKLRQELELAYGELQKADRYLTHDARRIAAMEASRFWKARNLWWRLKSWLGGAIDPTES